MKGWVVPGLFVLAAGLGDPSGCGEGSCAPGDAGSRLQRGVTAVTTGTAGLAGT